MEVDDYRNYDKALEALSEAYNILDKSPAADTYHAAISELTSRMTLIKAYLDAVQYVIHSIRLSHTVACYLGGTGASAPQVCTFIFSRLSHFHKAVALMSQRSLEGLSVASSPQTPFNWNFVLIGWGKWRATT